MKVTEIKKKINLKPLKLSMKETPHLTIETNLTCNIKCRGCYNLYKTYVKPLDKIKSDIDLAFKIRNLETITILGGEPTLHPELVEIITYIKKKNVYCDLLTNGVVFLEDGGDAFLEKIIAAGLDRIVLHVDEGQSHIYDDINRVRHNLFEKFEKKKIFFSLSSTIYHESKGKIPKIMQEYSRYRYFDGILALLEMKIPGNFYENHVPEKNPQLLYEYERISEELEVEPAAYIPSSLEDDFISWLMFFYYINTRTKKTMYGSPEYSRLIRKIYRFFTGRHVFGTTSAPWLFPLTFLLSCLIEILFHPKKIFEVLRIIQRSRWLKDLRFQYILLQNGPEFNHEKKQIQMCYHCPDATIRNNKLTPVCIADVINPQLENTGQEKGSEELYQTVYSHLEQI